MGPKPPSRAFRWQEWAAILGGWAALSVFLAPELYVYSLISGQSKPWREVLSLTFVNTAIAALFTPGIVWLTRRFPLERGRLKLSAPIHAAACVAFSLSHAWLYWLACYASHELEQTLFRRFNTNLLTYWAIVAVTSALDYFRRYRDREARLRQAQLDLLKTQLQPHFLFNTLHTISAMMHEDIAVADRMVSRLSDLLRLTLERIGQDEVTLRQELEFLESYFEIERARFQEELTLALEIEPEALEALVPTMFLQPLAENSIRHGFGERSYRGTVIVRAARRDRALVVSVADNGKGVGGAASPSARGGLGLANLVERLERLYPDEHALRVENVSTGGVRVTMEIPFRLAGPPDSSVEGRIDREQDSRADRGRRAVGSKADRLAPES